MGEDFYKWLFEHGEKVTVGVLLLCMLVLVLVAVAREWVISGKTHVKIIERLEEEVTRTREDCQKVRDQNDRLMAQAERQVTAAEVVARAVQRRTR